MFAYLMEKFGQLLERAEHSRRDAYLASSVDVFEVERRMRSIEINGYSSPRSLSRDGR